MSSDRVEKEYQARQAEAERLNKQIERDNRDAKAQETNRDAFAKLVRKGQEQQAEGKTKEERQAEAQGRQEQTTKGAKQSADAERAARMARGGVVHQNRLMEQAKSFQGVLQNQQAQTAEADQGRVARREEGASKDRIERDDRVKDVERDEVKREGDAEDVRVEARTAEAQRAGAAGGADAVNPDEKRKQQGQSEGEQGQQQQPKPAVEAAQKSSGPAPPKQIPPEILEKLVSAVWIGVNQKGLKEFQMELKDGPFKGALVKISNDGGRVSLRFERLDGDSKRLVEASKGELMRRLEAKGLSLSRLEVR